ncbi:hypothetical protein GCM10025868_38670 [Angustibacter aerolatus]|uniref:Uncharacterized protein n=1 Tax=Angustibacter aerolatus TaxID=1162965 RepID=A0ABQ6JK56_9ACTN|nr:hypothetical protein GCM10025868_38670 [Angustibacter aerolatus]
MRRMPITWKTTQTMIARTAGNAMRLIVGNCTGGMMPKRLFTRIRQNIENSSGTYFRNSFDPMTSRATLLRTRP